jgi:glutathione peroxidase
VASGSGAQSLPPAASAGYLSRMRLATLLILTLTASTFVAIAAPSVYQFSPLDIDGNPLPLASFRGKVLLIVNVASRCGFTYQYEGLQALYERYGDRGLVVLGFPSNDFYGQEPGTNAEIKDFCSMNFGVSFPMFSKITVRGKGLHPLYDHLTSTATNPRFAGAITWNFNKFLIGRDGMVIARFDSREEPLSAEMISAVEAALAQQ